MFNVLYKKLNNKINTLLMMDALKIYDWDVAVVVEVQPFVLKYSNYLF